MDRKVSKYFCIFCSNSSNLSTITEAYNHYKQHMKSNYYCINCDNNKKCSQKHNQSIDGSEESLIEMWIERFLSYQNELIDKSFRDLLNSCKLFTGCPVCESFLRLCNNNNIQIDVQSIRWSNNQSVANECRHASSHLRYYPFECLKCEKVGRYHKKCDMNEISRHIKDNHSINLKNSNFDGLVKSVKITKLESFIEFGFKNKNRLNFSNNNNNNKSLSSNSKVSKTIRTDNKTKPNVIEVVSEPKPKKPKIETQIIVANSNQRNDCNLKVEDKKKTTICTNNKSIILSINKKPNNVINEKKVIENLDQKSPKVELKFTPIIKTYSNSITNNTIKPKQNNLISGQQIIIKRQTNDCATVEIKSSPKPTNYLSQEFKDMMEDEEIDFIPNTCTPLTNNVYFCIFCTEKFTSKESAYHHIQNHVDYYPIMCLTCGEGLTDLQSFLIHHRETHPEAVKGRYKKKEQPVIDKWISSFLYSQTTITNAFPPRDQCPVCDRVFSRQEIESSRPRRCTINRRIDHLHRHMCYLPYECLKCKESGTEFYVAYFESKAHSHIKQKHPEIDDNESRWHIFQKTITIPKLDEFIESYLSRFGISMQFERRPVKKAKQFSSPEEFNNKNNFGLIDLNNSSLNLNMVFSDLIDSSNVLELNKDKLNIKSHNNKDIDLIVIDDNNDIAIDECVNNSNDSDIVVNVSPHSLFDKSVTFNAEEDSYFCIFCPTLKYFSKTDAYSHYGEHLDYLPVLCKICGFKFSNVDHLMTHHQSMHSTQTNVDYQICEDQILMKWVNEFLESQFDYQKAIKKVMPCSCSYNCPVCVKLINNQLSTSLIPCTQHNDVSFSVHIHQHLVYFPYECITCKRNGKTVRVPNLDSMAMNHLKEHKIESSSMYQLCKNFPKTLVIPKLEKMIGDSVHSKRMSEKKNKLDTSLIIPQIPQQSSSSFAVMENDSTSEQLKAHSPQPKTQHIRLEGRRVVNLPPKTTQENSTTNTNPVSLVNGTKEVMVANTNNICCFHCRQLFPNKKLFKDHHNESHPGKAIVCSITKNK